MMLNQEQINGNWNEIKGGIRNIWGDISDDELEETHRNIQMITSIVHNKYGESIDSIQEKMDRLMESFDNETDRNFIKNDHQTSYQRKPTNDSAQFHPG